METRRVVVADARSGSPRLCTPKSRRSDTHRSSIPHGCSSPADRRSARSQWSTQHVSFCSTSCFPLGRCEVLDHRDLRSGQILDTPLNEPTDAAYDHRIREIQKLIEQDLSQDPRAIQSIDRHHELQFQPSHPPSSMYQHGSSHRESHLSTHGPPGPPHGVAGQGQVGQVGAGQVGAAQMAGRPMTAPGYASGALNPTYGQPGAHQGGLVGYGQDPNQPGLVEGQHGAVYGAPNLGGAAYPSYAQNGRGMSAVGVAGSSVGVSTHMNNAMLQTAGSGFGAASSVAGGQNGPGQLTARGMQQGQYGQNGLVYGGSGAGTRSATPDRNAGDPNAGAFARLESPAGGANGNNRFGVRERSPGGHQSGLRPSTAPQGGNQQGAYYGSSPSAKNCRSCSRTSHSQGCGCTHLWASTNTRIHQCAYVDNSTCSLTAANKNQRFFGAGTGAGGVGRPPLGNNYVQADENGNPTGSPYGYATADVS